MQKPTIGRIVIYNTTEKERLHMKSNSEAGIPQNSQLYLPAIIVAVWSDTCINIKVHIDGFGTDLWRTSVSQGDGEGQWNWPKIEK